MNPLRVAHVGHIDAEDDRARWLDVCRWLQDNDAPFFDLLHAQEQRGELDQHCIDLNRSPPRDFLAEHDAHDVVITHHLWGEENEGYNIRSGGASAKPEHATSFWQGTPSTSRTSAPACRDTRRSPFRAAGT